MAARESDEFNHLAYLKAEAKKKQADADDAKKRLKEYEQDLWNRSSDRNTFGIKTDLGGFSLKSTTYGTISDFEAYKAWAEENDLADEFLKLDVESARLNELVRARLDTGQDLPPGVSYYERRYVSFSPAPDE
jgi:hypothetical protein